MGPERVRQSPGHAHFWRWKRDPIRSAPCSGNAAQVSSRGTVFHTLNAKNIWLIFTFFFTLEVSRSSHSTKRKWTQIEVAAIKAKMGRFIREGKTPGKEECQECIASSPEALKSRDWRAVKFFVRNRVVSLSRKTFK